MAHQNPPTKAASGLSIRSAVSIINALARPVCHALVPNTPRMADFGPRHPPTGGSRPAAIALGFSDFCYKM